MRNALLVTGILALVASVHPAQAQMCGPGQQAQAQPGMGGMMMCAPAAAPKAEGETKKPQASGMCPCCRNMAMMRGGGHHMPGMEMPKQ